MYNVLILGSGGREHALAWKISLSPLLQRLFVAPGNAGTAAMGVNVNLSPDDFEAIESFCSQQSIQIIVVGPEAPLVNGIWDYFEQHDILVIGPSKAGAMLEGSKSFAKSFMQEFKIPTAKYAAFQTEGLEDGLAYIDGFSGKVVLKADGLAAGKGVLILENKEEAKNTFREMLAGKFGDASATVVVEEFLEGIEYSVFVLTNGKDFKLFPIAKDYKRIGEGDTGLNTGGMGAISPVGFVDEALLQKTVKRIVEPTIQGISQKGMPYHGFVFIGLINVDGAPYVIEYNCRLGDPETEAILPRVENDLLELLVNLSSDNFADMNVQFSPKSAATVMLVSGGYPESYEKGKVLNIPEFPTNSLAFHAGTKVENNTILTNGGRVLAITSLANTQEMAIEKSLELADKLSFEGKYYRRDIGFDLR